MKKEYVGDINDFAKYSLLRQMAGSPGPNSFRLGVIWYLTPDEGKDGRRVKYLADPHPNVYSEADQELFMALGLLVNEARRDVSQVEAAYLLPKDSIYFAEPLIGQDRSSWLEHALSATGDCDLVFLDPDNGLASPTVSKRSTKHATVEELRHFLERGQSVITVQFFRRSPHAKQLQDWLLMLQNTLPVAHPGPFALRWHKDVSLGFLVIPSERHAFSLFQKAQTLVSGRWKRLFELHEVEE